MTQCNDFLAKDENDIIGAKFAELNTYSKEERSTTEIVKSPREVVIM